MFPFVVADIGGTNARFALACDRKESGYEFDQITILQGADFPKFEEALAHFLASLNGIQPRHACVAIAGPVTGDHVSMTNLAWRFSKSDVKKQFNLDTFVVINDFAAFSMATSLVDVQRCQVVRQGVINPEGNKAALGPGTGLGIGGLVVEGGKYYPVASEAGHTNLPVATPFEAEILKAGLELFGYVSAETFISGPGFVNLYHAVCLVAGVKPRSYTPPDVTGLALEKKDGQCEKAMNAFFAFLGSVTSNVALNYSATGGVFFAGGILPRFYNELLDSAFMERFEEKGKMNHFVQDIPIYLIDKNYDVAAFDGAAATLDQII